MKAEDYLQRLPSHDGSGLKRTLDGELVGEQERLPSHDGSGLKHGSDPAESRRDESTVS